MNPGTLAATTFLLLTGLGAVAQVLKLYARERAWCRGELARPDIYSGLLPVRELWSYTAFMLFALSGITRPTIDLYLIVSRLPVVALTTLILFYLARHGAAGARAYLRLALLGDIALVACFAAILRGFEPSTTLLPAVVDAAVAFVGVFLVYGKLSQAREMYRTKRSGAVSWFREGGLVLKDLTGLYYAYTVGASLLFIGITHALSLMSSSTICIVKYLLESKHRVDASPPYGGASNQR